MEAAIFEPVQLEILLTAGIPSKNQESRPGLFQKNASMPPLVILTQEIGGSSADFGLGAGRTLSVPLCIGGHREIMAMNGAEKSFSRPVQALAPNCKKATRTTGTDTTATPM